jgi:toxin ParE1/3/4
MSRQRRFVLTPEARADLIEIWSYISEDGIDAPDRALARIDDAFRRLAQTPGMGHYREDLADSRHRFWTLYSYVIAYRWETKPLQIKTHWNTFKGRQRAPQILAGLLAWVPSVLVPVELNGGSAQRRPRVLGRCSCCGPPAV